MTKKADPNPTTNLEKKPLIHHQSDVSSSSQKTSNAAAARASTCSIRIVRLGNGLLLVTGIVLGVASTFLFKEACEKYGEDSDIGKWLNKYTQKIGIPSGDIFWVASGIEFGAVVALATYSMGDIVTYLKQFKSIITKILMGGAIILVGGALSTQPPSVTYATGGNELDIALAFVGSITVSYMNSVNVLKQLQIVKDLLNKYYVRNIAKIPRTIFGVSHNARLLEDDLYKTLEALKSNLRAGLLQHYHKGTYPQGETLIDLWINMTKDLDPNANYQDSWLYTIAKTTSQALPVSLGAYYYGDSLIESMVNKVMPAVLPEKINGPWTSGILGVSLSILPIFMIAKFVWDGIGATFDKIKRGSEFKALDLWLYQTFFKVSIALTVVGSLAAIPSYPLILSLYDSFYHSLIDDIDDDFGRGFIIAFILAFHYLGVQKLGYKGGHKLVEAVFNENSEAALRTKADNAVVSVENILLSSDTSQLKNLEALATTEHTEELNKLLGTEMANNFRGHLEHYKGAGLFGENRILSHDEKQERQNSKMEESDQEEDIQSDEEQEENKGYESP